MWGVCRRQAPSLELGVFVSKHSFSSGGRLKEGETTYPSAWYFGVHIKRSWGREKKSLL